MQTKIFNAILGYMAGDAYGVPWEGRPRGEIDLQAAKVLPRRSDWPKGSTSDDTEQLLLVIDVLIDGEGRIDPHAFMQALSAVENMIRGIGPSTSAALLDFRQHGKVTCGKGSTNGAAMRSPPLGWVHSSQTSAARREAVTRLSRTTHGWPEATFAAQIIAAMASSSLTADNVAGLIDAADREASHWSGITGCTALSQSIKESCGNDVFFGEGGISLDAVETVSAVIQVLRRGETLREIYDGAISLGGDTDTVAALAGGLAAPLFSDLVYQAPWLDTEMKIDRAHVQQLAGRLAEFRYGNE